MIIKVVLEVYFSINIIKQKLINILQYIFKFPYIEITNRK